MSQTLPPRFDPDDRLKVADDGRVGVRAGDRADAVKGRFAGGRPVADGFIHRVLERGASGVHGNDSCAQRGHAFHVGSLPGHVERAHEDVAPHPQQGGDGGGGNTVHSRSGLGDQTGLAHAFGQQSLSDGVVDLVGSGVVEVFPLEVDFRAAAVGGEPFCEVEGGFPAHVVGEQFVKFCLESRIPFRLEIGGLQFVKHRHQGLRNVLDSEWSVMAFHHAIPFNTSKSFMSFS